jgi:hypothetical protein
VVDEWGQRERCCRRLSGGGEGQGAAVDDRR